MQPDEDRPKRTFPHVIGQDLATLSVDELDERIAALQAEIVRLEAARRSKADTRSAADALFKF